MAEENTGGDIKIQGLNHLLSAYGPFAFGLVALLAIWMSIVRPQLEDAKLDFERQQQIVDSLGDITQSQAKTSESLKQTSLILERLLSRLDK